MNDKPAQWQWRHALALLLLGAIGQVLWIISIAALLGWDSDDLAAPSMSQQFVAQAWLWLIYGAAPLIVVITMGRGPVADLLTRITWRDIPIGVAAGLGVQLIIVPLLYWPVLEFTDFDPGEAARELTDRVDGRLDVILLIIIVGVMAPLVEELFYRGMLLGALRRVLGDGWGNLAQAVIFGAAHFQLLQFPALVIVGWVFGYLTIRYGRLGPAWMAHAAFNGITLVNLLFLT